MTSTTEWPTEPRARPARPRSYARAAGLLAAAGALVAGELAGRLLPGGVSPVVAVGNRVVELTPDGPRRAGISAFGSLDKPLLLGGILLVVALLALWCGDLTERSRTRAELVVLALSVVVLAAVLPDNGATLPGAVLTAVAITCRYRARPDATHASNGLIQRVGWGVGFHSANRKVSAPGSRFSQAASVCLASGSTTKRKFVSS